MQHPVAVAGVLLEVDALTPNLSFLTGQLYPTYRLL